MKKAYGRVARKKSCCCGSASCYKVPGHPVPEAELGLSCGNPVAFSHLRKGDVVLDLGSGAGKDVFLAAQKVGPKGRAIGVDMTPDMLRLARKNAAKFEKAAGLSNVEFREGQIEQLPVEDSAVDVVISNCVINLSPDKPQVFREVFRVLKPGGRMVVSDIVLYKPLPDWARKDEDLYAACVAGALLKKDYLRAIRQAGFKKLDILDEHAYGAPDAIASTGDNGSAVSGAEGIAASITVLAAK